MVQARITKQGLNPRPDGVGSHDMIAGDRITKQGLNLSLDGVGSHHKIGTEPVTLWCGLT